MAKILKCDGCLIAEAQMGVDNATMNDWRMIRCSKVDEDGDQLELVDEYVLCPQCIADMMFEIDGMRWRPKRPLPPDASLPPSVRYRR